MVLSNVMFYVSELKLWRNRNCQGDFLLLFVFVFCKVMFLVGQGLASFLSVFFFFLSSIPLKGNMPRHLKHETKRKRAGVKLDTTPQPWKITLSPLLSNEMLEQEMQESSMLFCSLSTLQQHNWVRSIKKLTHYQPTP